jgi:hypothetical protein
MTFQNSLGIYIRHLESIYNTLPMTMILLEPFHKEAHDELTKFHSSKVGEGTNKDGEPVFVMKLEDKPSFDGLQRNLTISSLAQKVLPESLFVSLISQYDAFIGRLLVSIYEAKPEMLNSSEKSLTFSQIVQLGGIEEAREFIVEKEVDSVIRDSHSDHFLYLENKLGIPLRKDLKIWNQFIEITERRNLFVHCDGVISRQYINKCKELGLNVEKFKIGDRLSVPHEYFKKSFEILYELAVKLTHTVWRKLKIDEIEQADDSLNNICYGLLEIGEFSLADNLLEFACEQKRHHNEATKNILIINKILSKHLQGKTDECIKMVESKDWSASSDEFKLAILVLQEKEESVYEMMKKIGKNGQLGKDEYKMWPLFYKIRKKQEFKDLFKEIFTEEYTIIEKPLMPLHNLIRERKRDIPLKTKKRRTMHSTPTTAKA